MSFNAVGGDVFPSRLVFRPWHLLQNDCKFENKSYQPARQTRQARSMARKRHGYSCFNGPHSLQDHLFIDHRAGEVVYPHHALGAVIVEDRLDPQENGIILNSRSNLEKLPLAACILDTAVGRVMT